LYKSAFKGNFCGSTTKLNIGVTTNLPQVQWHHNYFENYTAS